MDRKLRSRRSGSGIAEQLLKNAPQTCQIKIICDGNEVVIDNTIEFPSSRSSSTDNDSKSPHSKGDVQHRDSSSWMCFKAKLGEC